MFHIWAGLEPAREVTGRTSTSTAGSEEMPESVPTPIAYGESLTPALRRRWGRRPREAVQAVPAPVLLLPPLGPIRSGL